MNKTISFLIFTFLLTTTLFSQETTINEKIEQAKKDFVSLQIDMEITPEIECVTSSLVPQKNKSNKNDAKELLLKLNYLKNEMIAYGNYEEAITNYNDILTFINKNNVQINKTSATVESHIWTVIFENSDKVTHNKCTVTFWEPQ